MTLGMSAPVARFTSGQRSAGNTETPLAPVCISALLFLAGWPAPL